MKRGGGKCGTPDPRRNERLPFDPRSFFESKTAEQLRAEQGVAPITDLEALSGFIPDEDLDEFVAEIYRDREQGVGQTMESLSLKVEVVLGRDVDECTRDACALAARLGLHHVSFTANGLTYACGPNGKAIRQNAAGLESWDGTKWQAGRADAER